MINLLVGLQFGNIKYPCFPCLWHSRARDKHLTKKEWLKRLKWKIDSNNVKHESFVDPKQILVPPLHVKLGLMKQFVKALNKKSQCYRYIQTLFPHLSDAKIKEGIFVGPDIKKLIKGDNFVKIMTTIETGAWLSFKKVTENFLENNRDMNYKIIVSSMLKNFVKLGCLVCLKLHYLFSHLDYFPENVGALSVEMGEQLHEVLKNQQHHYQGR